MSLRRICALIAMIISPGCLDVAAQPVLDENSYEACSIFATVLHEARDGVATGAELRGKIQQVYTRASQLTTTSKELRQAATALLRAATAQQGVGEAVKTMAAACLNLDHPRFRGLSQRSSAPITEDEAARQLRGILERSGETPTNCRQKQYGAGWVTVCD